MRNRSLSDFWRDYSEDRVLELTSVLQGADGMIGVMGSGVRATWSTNGKSETWWMRLRAGKLLSDTDKIVFLDYTPIANLKPPFDGRAVDEIIGYAAHEGGHCLWTDGANATDTVTVEMQKLPRFNTTPAQPPRRRRKSTIDPKVASIAPPAPSEQQVTEALRVLNIIEDAFIDYHVAKEWPVLGEYIQWARKQIHVRRPIDMGKMALQENPPRNHVMNLWIGCSLYGEDIPEKTSDSIGLALNFLLQGSVKAVQTPSHDERCKIAVECWECLQQFADNPDPMPNKPKEKAGQEKKGESKEDPQESEGEGKGESESGETGQDSGQEQEKPESGTDSKKQDKAEDKAEKPEREKPEDKTEGEAGKDDQQGEKGEERQSEEGESEEAESEESEGEQGEAEGGMGEEKAGDGEGDDSGESDASAEESGDQGFAPASGEAPDEETGENKPEPEGEEKGGDGQGSPGNLDEFDLRDITGLPEEVLNEVLDAIAHELEDLSKSVSAVMNAGSNLHARTKRADYDGPSAQKATEQVEPEIIRLRQLFERQKMEASRSLTGLNRGKLDSRRLARVGAGNFNVLRRREVLGKPDMDIGLLMDVSGSMDSNMGMVWQTAAMFGEALVRADGINFLCLTYTGGWMNVQTTMICSKEMGKLCLGNVDLGGGTPSGPAIATMKVHLDRMPGKKKVVIHFTDGSPDDSGAVMTAVEACRKDGIEVWAIGLQGMERQLAVQYGQEKYRTISTIRELPEKVGELLQTLVMDR